MLRHAFCIIAHNEPHILDVLLSKLDAVEGMSFVHIDRKVKGEDLEALLAVTRRHRTEVVKKRMNVVWGDYSQIACTLAVYETALKGHYDYYHLLSGVDLPVKPAEYITRFFEEHKGKEFISVHNEDGHLEDQMYYSANWYHFFQPLNRTALGGLLWKCKVKQNVLRLQKFLGVSRCRHDDKPLYKGHCWMSLTDAAVRYLIERKPYIRKRFRYTSCADELFAQTVLYNSPFRANVYRPALFSALRLIDWERGNPYTWTMADLETIKNSPCLFARKFSTAKDAEIVEYLSKN